jgi:hypothetical protein
LQIHLKRFCDTCLILKHSKVSHCGNCDHCVVDFDHHCNYVNKCIGRNNVWNFTVLSLFGGILSLNFIISTIIYVKYSLNYYDLNEDDQWSIMKNIYSSFFFIPIAIIRPSLLNFICVFYSFWCLLVLTVYIRKIPE